MIQKLREKVKNKKGFTLVELIVVLVILAILIAMLVPSLTGYIDKAQDKKILAEAKLALNAAQTVVGEAYSTKETITSPMVVNSEAADKAKEIYDLAEFKDEKQGTKIAFSNGKIETLVYTDGEKRVQYVNGKWGKVVKGSSLEVTK